MTTVPLQLQFDNGVLTLSGVLDSASVQVLWDQQSMLVMTLSEIALSGLVRTDTAGLAMLVHLVAQARSHGQRVRLTGVSEKLSTLSLLYNLPTSLFPVAV